MPYGPACCPVGPANIFEGCFRQAKCHVVTQTQGYHLVCIWGSLIKFQGGGGLMKFLFKVRFINNLPVKRGIKLPISARHWHILVARFSKKQI